MKRKRGRKKKKDFAGVVDVVSSSSLRANFSHTHKIEDAKKRRKDRAGLDERLELFSPVFFFSIFNLIHLDNVDLFCHEEFRISTYQNPSHLVVRVLFLLINGKSTGRKNFKPNR